MLFQMEMHSSFETPCHDSCYHDRTQSWVALMLNEASLRLTTSFPLEHTLRHMHDQIVLNVNFSLVVSWKCFAYSTLIVNHSFFMEPDFKPTINSIGNSHFCATVRECYDNDLNLSEILSNYIKLPYHVWGLSLIVASSVLTWACM